MTPGDKPLKAQGHDGLPWPWYLVYRGQVLDMDQSVESGLQTLQLLQVGLARAYARLEAGRGVGNVIPYRGTTCN